MFDLTLYRLLVFVHVVEAGSFRAAAAKLRITQPAVSAHIKQLEATAGLTLLGRDRGRRFALTEAGRLLYDYAREVVEATAETDRLLGELQEARSGGLTAGAVANLGRHRVPPVLVAFQEAHPGVRIALHVGPQQRIEEEVARGEVDVAVLYGASVTDGLVAEVVGTEELVLVASPDHPLARKRAITPPDLLDAPFVAGLRASPYQRSLEAHLARWGLPSVRILMEVEDADAMRPIVAAGLGIAALHRSTVAGDVAAGRLAVLDLADPLPPREIQLVYRPRRQLSPVVKRFLATAREVLRESQR